MDATDKYWKTDWCQNWKLLRMVSVKMSKLKLPLKQKCQSCKEATNKNWKYTGVKIENN